MNAPKHLVRRVIEIDYRHKHRHAPGSLSALPIICGIFECMQPDDVFILSKGHACAALYAVLENRGFKPRVELVHPERDPENGVTITSGSLGHGLPVGVGIAHARKLAGRPSQVHVLMGDGECLEGTTWEALHLAHRLRLHERQPHGGRFWLMAHVDANGLQGADYLLDDTCERMSSIYPGVRIHFGLPGSGVPFFEGTDQSVHQITDAEFAAIMEDLQ